MNSQNEGSSEIKDAAKDSSTQSKEKRDRQRRMWIAALAIVVLAFIHITVVCSVTSNFAAAHFWLLAGVYVIVLAAGIYTDKLTRLRLVFRIAWVTVAFGLFYACTAPPTGIRDKAEEVEIKQNLHAIQLAIEKYGAAHDGAFPASIIELLAGQDWMHSLPNNPFTKPIREMQPISFGSAEPWGDFTYLPLEEDGAVVGYYLLAYGSERTWGQDVNGDGAPDYVIIVLSSESEGAHYDNEYGQTRGDLPPLASLLAEQSGVSP